MKIRQQGGLTYRSLTYAGWGIQVVTGRWSLGVAVMLSRFPLVQINVGPLAVGIGRFW